MYSSHKLIDLLQLLPFQAQASARCFFFSHNQKIQLMPLNSAYVATSPTTVGAIVGGDVMKRTTPFLKRVPKSMRRRRIRWTEKIPSFRYFEFEWNAFN